MHRHSHRSIQKIISEKISSKIFVVEKRLNAIVKWINQSHDHESVEGDLSVNQILVTSYSGTNVTTSAYVQIGVTSVSTAALLITDTSGKILKIAVAPLQSDGSFGTTEDIAQCPVSGTAQINLGTIAAIPLGSKLYLKAIDATASTGYNVTTVLG